MKKEFYDQIEQYQKSINELSNRIKIFFDRHKQQLQEQFSTYFNKQVKFLYYDFNQCELHLLIKADINEHQKIIKQALQYQSATGCNFFILPIFEEQ